jgi:hypothetical protein
VLVRRDDVERSQSDADQRVELGDDGSGCRAESGGDRGGERLNADFRDW